MLIATPEAPQQGGLPDPEALIKEARQRQRRRRARIAATILAASGAALILWDVFGPGSSSTANGAGRPSAIAASNRCPGTDLGEVAYVRAGALDVVDFARCTPTTLVTHGVSGSPAFSADGTYVAFAGGYVAAAGGAVHRVASTGLVWSPARTLLAYATKAGAIELLVPGTSPHQLVGASWHASSPMFSPDGKTIVFAGGDGLATVAVAGGSPRSLVHASAIPFGFSPDGRYFLYHAYPGGSSLADDGMTLVAVSLATGKQTTIATTLGRSDFATWCGNNLAYVTNHAGRSVTMGDGIALASPPSWKSVTVLPEGGTTSWNAPVCAGGRLAVSAGPSSSDAPFGQEHRSLWLVPAHANAMPELLAREPATHLTDELPMWSANGRYLVYVRTTPAGINATGRLYAYDLAGRKTIGPIASVGCAGNYYGSYSWANQIAWHR
jgi:Tol biopolymer transport system component